MEKKYLIFGMAAILGASLSFFGCEQDAKTETVTDTRYVAGDVTGLIALLDDGVTPIRYIGELEITSETVFVPAGTTVNVDDGVTISGGVLGVAGTLNLGEGKGIVSSGGFVAGDAALLAKVTGTATKAQAYSTLADATAALATESTAAILAVKSSELTSASVPAAGKTLYVLGDLTFDSAPASATTGDVKAYGNFVIANASVDLTAAVVANLDITAATLTNTAAATVTLPTGTATIKAIKAGDAALTLAGATGLALGSLTGSVTLPAGITAVAIEGGTGSVTITPTAALTLTTASFGNTGKTTFGGALAVSLPASATFGGDVEFGGNVTITDGAAFDGNAVFKGTLTLTDGDLTVSGNLAVTGATSLGGDLAVDGTATLAALGNTAEATAAFNGTTTTGAVTNSTGALTIAGSGAVTLGEVTTDTSANLVVANTTGVTIPTATIVASTSIDASAGKVIFGTADNNATIEKGTLASNANGLATVAANGVVGVPFSTDAASLTLAATGSISFAGNGILTVGATYELKGADSTWTAGADTVTFTPTAAAAAKIEGGTSATLTPSGAAAELRLLAASAAQALTIAGTTQFTLDLSAAGKITFDATTAASTITLTANTDGIKLTGSLAIVGTNDTDGSPFTGAFVDGTGSYDATTCNVSLIDGIIKHSTTNAAAPAAIDKATTAASLAKADS